MPQSFELALDTFGDVTSGPDGQLLPQAQVIRQIVEEGALADQVGVDYFGLGEHHRDDMVISSPEVILAAIAARTQRIKLGTAVTVLSSDDPVRLFQRFSTLQAISSERAEVILGRGSFIESFPLFGFDLRDYEKLFEDKLDLFSALLHHPKVTWSGQTRPPLENQPVYPPLGPAGLKTWIGVGGTPESVQRAVRYRMPLMIAIIGGTAARFRPLVDLYLRLHAEAGTPPQDIGVHSPGHVGDTDEQAREEFWPHFQAKHARMARERGWAAMTKGQFLMEVEQGALYVGSPQTVARRIAATAKTLGLNRFEMKYSSGPMPHEVLMRSIERYGTQVAPLVRELLASESVR